MTALKRIAPQSPMSRPAGDGLRRSWITSAVDRLDHLVTPEAMEAARTMGRRLVTACGAQLLSAALCAPPQRRCQSCLSLLLPAQRQVDRSSALARLRYRPACHRITGTVGTAEAASIVALSSYRIDHGERSYPQFIFTPSDEPCSQECRSTHGWIGTTTVDCTEPAKADHRLSSRPCTSWAT